ncbi:MAG: RNA methyltransferase [Bacteroidetes bacterium]|nr:RNA methyltransferase [Bacteroidota bacterium]
MLTKNEIRYYSSLLQKKNRVIENKFIAEGKKLVSEAIESGYNNELVICTNLFKENNKKFLSSGFFDNRRIEVINNHDFEKLCETKTPQGIAGVFLIKEIKDAGEISTPIAAALENISDPGNMGAVLRNCDWFGIKNIIISGGCAEVYSPKVLRASMGSIFHLNIYEAGGFINYLINLQLKKYSIITADLKGENLYKFEKRKKNVIVFCNEANGPTRELIEISDSLINIPRKGKAESLNVASASAVILSELTKQ